MEPQFLMSIELKPEDVIGFTRTPACDDHHCPYSAKHTVPHGHFEMRHGVTVFRKVYWWQYTYDQAKAELARLNLPQVVRSKVAEDIHNLFSPPPNNLVPLRPAA